MGKLHEVIAVEKDLEGKKNRIVRETADVFRSKAGLFEGMTKTYAPLEEDGDKYPAENVVMETTVPARIKYTLPTLAKYMDAVCSKECTNTKATASVEVGGEIVLEDMPATALLNLESRLKEMRLMLEAIPTLTVNLEWKEDERRENTFMQAAAVSQRSVKHEDFVVVVKPTEFHPAEIRPTVVDKVVGNWTTVNCSGKISSIEKSRLLENCDTLLQATKQARQRANMQEVEEKNISDSIFSFIFDEKYLK